MRVRWLKIALANLDAEAEYIAEDNPAAAGRVVQKISRAVDQLKKNPAMGRAGRVAGTRELVVVETPYIIPYRVRGDAVEILRVFHATRKWPEEGFTRNWPKLIEMDPATKQRVDAMWSKLGL